MNAKVKGYLLGAIAAATYGTNPLFALPLYKEGMDPDSVLFFRYLFAIPIVGFMIKSRGRSFKVQKKEIIPIIVMGLLMSVSSLTLFESYNYMEAGIASTILFVYPILVALIMAIFFKEKLTIQTLVCIGLALVGISLLYQSEDGTTLNTVGIAFVVASALSYAIYIVGVNQPLLKQVATLTLTFYALVVGLCLFLVRVKFGQELFIIDKWYLWGNLLALAIFPTAISFLCTTSAIQYIGSTPTAILGALEPLTAVFFSITVFAHRDGHRPHHPRRDAHHRRRKHHASSGAFPEIIPQTAPEKNGQELDSKALLQATLTPTYWLLPGGKKARLAG